MTQPNEYFRDRYRRLHGLGDGSGRACPECGEPVVGRIDKKFCTVRCQQRQGNRRYHESHREEERARFAARRDADPEGYRAANHAYYATHKERSLELSRRYAAANPNIHVLYVHGIAPAELHTLYEAQGGRCAICDTPGPERGVGCLHIDHDHANGQRRGLICNDCNRTLPLLEKYGESWALRALAYLADPPLPRMRKESAS
jgi:Recombination endonuclease VII